MKEIFKDISGYEGHYQASNLGRIKSLERTKNNRGKSQLVPERVLKASPDSDNYLKVQLCQYGRRRTFKVHKLVMITFVADRPKGLQINHIDGNKQNNALSNLEYCTQSENMRHAYGTKLQVPIVGEKHYAAKLTRNEVVEIKTYLKDTPKFYGMLKVLADKYGVSSGYIGEISRELTWKHIKV